MLRIRIGLGAVGLVGGLYGGWLVLSRGHDLLNLVLWLAAGVVLHDGVLSLAVLLAGVVAHRTLPAAARTPVVVGSVLLGSLTLLAIPVLGRFGARPDNATLLDRHYTLGWLILVALTAAGVAGATVVRSRRRQP